MGAEAVLLTPAVGLAVLRVLSLLLLPVLPLAAVPGATVALGPGRTRFTPFVEIAAVLLGVLFAPLLLAASTTDHIMVLHEIFRTNGPWDLDFGQFVTMRALPLLLSPFLLIGQVVTGEASPDVFRAALLLGIPALAVIGAPALVLRNDRGISNSVRNLILAAWGAYATIYTVALLLWVANMLNFWCFLVLFALTLLIHD
jgi:hypothetical protein